MISDLPTACCKFKHVAVRGCTIGPEKKGAHRVSVDLPPSALATLARHGLLRPFLRQQLLSEALASELLSAEDRQQALEGFVRERRLGNGEELERYRQEQLLSPEALAEQIEQPLRMRRHCDRLYRPKAEARFLDRKSQLDRVVYSLLRLSDGGLARELYLQLQEGEAHFADLAALHSEGPERGTRGIVGPVPLTQAHPQLVQRLSTGAPGVVQEPFRIERWWLVVRLESLSSASFDEAMAQQMAHELLEQWLDQGVEARLQELRPLLLAPPAGVSR
jgi:parvulin-like peptidyl-prolyl isomerase